MPGRAGRDKIQITDSILDFETQGMYNYRLRTGRGVEIMNGDTVGAPLTYTGIRSLATDRDSCDADRDLTDDVRSCCVGRSLARGVFARGAFARGIFAHGIFARGAFARGVFARGVSPAASRPRRSPLAVPNLEDRRERVRHLVCHKRCDLQRDDTVVSFELSVGASAIAESPVKFSRIRDRELRIRQQILDADVFKHLLERSEEVDA